MCRVLGCVASEPVSIRHEPLEAENPLVHQSWQHDSGWGIAADARAEVRRIDGRPELRGARRGKAAAERARAAAAE